MKIGFDMDGCLSRFDLAYAECLTKYTGITFPITDPSFPSAWYWEREAGVTKEQEKYIWENNILKLGSKFWEHLEPLNGAIEALRLINKLSVERKLDAYFITHRMGNGAKLQTEKWLYKYHINYPTVIMTGNKLPIINSLGLDAFIDDRPETIEEVAQGSIARIYIKDTPYNRHVAEDHRITRVDSVMAMLTKEGLI